MMKKVILRFGFYIGIICENLRNLRVKHLRHFSGICFLGWAKLFIVNRL